MKALDNQALTSVYGLVQDYIMWDYHENMNMSYHQISQLIGCAEKTVYRTIRALRELEKADQQTFDEWVDLAEKAYNYMSENVKWGENNGKERA